MADDLTIHQLWCELDRLMRKGVDPDLKVVVSIDRDPVNGKRQDSVDGTLTGSHMTMPENEYKQERFVLFATEDSPYG